MSKASAEHSRVVPFVATNSEGIGAAFSAVRAASESLCQTLEAEDCQIQTMPDVSPTKWHLAHVSWFFETFILQPYLADYRPFHPQFAHLFNSYYETVGSFHPRPQRGLLSRPTLKQIYDFRAYVNEHMQRLLQQQAHPDRDAINLRTLVGINHEQQHQELMLTDIKHVFAMNPLKPVYQDKVLPQTENAPSLSWVAHPGGLVTIGNQ